MNGYNVVFSERALNDIEEAIGYYNSKQPDLGKKFALEIQSTLSSIKLNPFYTSVRYNDVRCAAVSVFPFLVHYQVDSDNSTVRILSVYNTHRKPFW